LIVYLEEPWSNDIDLSNFLLIHFFFIFRQDVEANTYIFLIKLHYYWIMQCKLKPINLFVYLLFFFVFESNRYWEQVKVIKHLICLCYYKNYRLKESEITWLIWCTLQYTLQRAQALPNTFFNIVFLQLLIWKSSWLNMHFFLSK
jgi:hypothetical protein